MTLGPHLHQRKDRQGTPNFGTVPNLLWHGTLRLHEPKWISFLSKKVRTHKQERKTIVKCENDKYFPLKYL